MAQHSIQSALELALQHYRERRMQEAERLCREFPAQQPDHAEAIHFLGVVAFRTRKFDNAADLFGRSIALDSRSPEARYNYSNALAQNGKVPLVSDDAIVSTAGQRRFKEHYCAVGRVVGPFKAENDC